MAKSRTGLNLSELTSEDKPRPQMVPLRVVVCDVQAPKDVQSTSQKQAPTVCVVADNSAACRCVAYGQHFQAQLTNNKSVLLLGYTVYRGNLYLREKGTVGDIPPLPLSEEMVNKAKQLLHPQTPESPIKTALALPQRTPASVSGTIIAVEDPTTVPVAGHDVPIRNIKVKDDTASIQICLWRDHSVLDLSVGKDITVTNATTAFFQGSTSLNTNYRSEITITEPKQRSIKVHILALTSKNVKDSQLICEMANQDIKIYDISSTLIPTDLLYKLPIFANLQFLGQTISDLQICTLANKLDK